LYHNNSTQQNQNQTQSWSNHQINTHQISEKIVTELDKTTTTTATTPAQFQIELVRNILDESLQSFRYQIHMDIQNMHLELLRQFQIQKVINFILFHF